MTAPTYAWFKATIKPQTALISPLVGDMLFGQVCATLAQTQGAPVLEALLTGYTTGSPFCVISDAFPADFLPKPAVPLAIATTNQPQTTLTGQDRKNAKKKIWVPTSALSPLNAIHNNVTPSIAALWTAAQTLPEHLHSTHASETHNSINRLTNTTDASFTPYSLSSIWHSGDLNVYCVVDTARFNASQLHTVLTQIGQWGYGKEATTGKGKFTLQALEQWSPPSASSASDTKKQYWWTLAACAPQGLGFDAQESYYTPVTRYPRHGGQTLHISPYKTPLLMANTAAVFAEMPAKTASQRHFIGQGLGGIAAPISQALPATVHQGYAPAIPVVA